MHIYRLLVLLLFCNLKPVSAQETLYQANDEYELMRYVSAVPLYTKAFNKKPSYEAASKLALCHYRLRNFDEALSWFETALNQPKFDPKIRLVYAEVLKQNQQYGKAKAQYKLLAIEIPSNRVLYEENASLCDSALLKSKFISKSSVSTLSDINTEMSEIAPFVFGKSVVFASNQKSAENDYKNINPEDGKPYYSLYKGVTTNDQIFDPLFYAGIIPNGYHEGPASFSKNGDTVFYTTVNMDKSRKNKINTLDIYLGFSNLDGTGFMEEIPFQHNTPDFSEGHPCISKDGTTLYFVSNRPNGYGGSDLYYCIRVGEGWSEPLNMGPRINTAYDELFPFENVAGELYFSSNRPNSIGGLDIYVSKQENNAWQFPVQLPNPINSSRDDFGITFLPNSSQGFFSSNRTGGKGSDDIYGFVFVPEDSYTTVTPTDVAQTDSIGQEPQDTTSLAEENPNAQKTLKIDDLRLETNEDSSFVLTGKVQEFIDSIAQPLSSEIVIVIIDPCGDQQTTLSDLDGKFRVEKIEDNVYVIRASKEGYFTNSVNVKLDPPNPEVMVIDEMQLLENIEYDFNSAKIKKESLPQLDVIAAVMKANPKYSIFLKSYTDERGSDVYNLNLSRKRAQSVYNYLVSQGISKNRLTSKGYGETNLIVPNAQTEEQHQVNRRTEFKWIIAK